MSTILRTWAHRHPNLEAILEPILDLILELILGPTAGLISLASSRIDIELEALFVFGSSLANAHDLFLELSPDLFEANLFL